MAIVKNGILGPISNKVGTVIGRNFRGLNVITALYKKSNKRATDSQRQERDRLGVLSSFLARAQRVVDKGFSKTVKGGQSPLNAAYAFNYPKAFVAVEQGVKLNFPKIVLSRGPVERPDCATVKREGNKIIFNWLAGVENRYGRYDDKASFLIYGIALDNIRVFEYKVERSDLQVEFEFPEKFMEDTFHCYMVFSSQNGKLVSNSEYVGVLPI